MKYKLFFWDHAGPSSLRCDVQIVVDAHRLDTCRLPLRGFPITQYLSNKSLYGQAEARWRFYKRWGLVAFAGVEVVLSGAVPGQ